MDNSTVFIVSQSWAVSNQTVVQSDSVYSNHHRLLERVIPSCLCKHTQATHINAFNFHGIGYKQLLSPWVCRWEVECGQWWKQIWSLSALKLLMVPLNVKMVISLCKEISACGRDVRTPDIISLKPACLHRRQKKTVCEISRVSKNCEAGDSCYSTAFILLCRIEVSAERQTASLPLPGSGGSCLASEFFMFPGRYPYHTKLQDRSHMPSLCLHICLLLFLPSQQSWDLKPY